MIETIKAAKEINVGIKNFNNSTYFVCLAFNNMESCSFKRGTPKLCDCHLCIRIQLD